VSSQFLSSREYLQVPGVIRLFLSVVTHPPIIGVTLFNPVYHARYSVVASYRSGAPGVLVRSHPRSFLMPPHRKSKVLLLGRYKPLFVLRSSPASLPLPVVRAVAPSSLVLLLRSYVSRHLVQQLNRKTSPLMNPYALVLHRPGLASARERLAATRRGVPTPDRSTSEIISAFRNTSGCAVLRPTIKPSTQPAVLSCSTERRRPRPIASQRVVLSL